MLTIKSFDYNFYSKCRDLKTGSFKIKKLKTERFNDLKNKEPFCQVPFKLSDKFDYSWDAEKQILNLSVGCSASDLFHESAHYFICPPSRKKYNDFGLGQGFDSSVDSSLHVSYSASQKEEELACLLEWIFIYNFIKKDIAKTINVIMDLENFMNLTEDGFNSLLTHLKTHNKRFSAFDFCIL